MSHSITLDYEPIVVIKIRGDVSDVDLFAMSATVTLAMRQHCAAGVRTATVLDLSEAGPLSASQRKIIGLWRADVRELTERVSVGIAVVVKSPVVRSILTTISWFHKEPVPQVYVESFEEGIAWALARCTATGIHVPSHVRIRLDAQREPRRMAAEP